MRADTEVRPYRILPTQRAAAGVDGGVMRPLAGLSKATDVARPGRPWPYFVAPHSLETARFRPHRCVTNFANEPNLQVYN